MRNIVARWERLRTGRWECILGYASRKGYSLIEGQLFMPEKWFEEDHAEQRKACGVPEGLIFKTKPEIGLELLQNAVKRGNLPFLGCSRRLVWRLSCVSGRCGRLWASGISLTSRVQLDLVYPAQGSCSPMERSRSSSNSLASERYEDASHSSQQTS